jgi:hypothetical protein
MLKITTDLRGDGLSAYLKRLPDALDGGAEAAMHQVKERWRQEAHEITGAYRASIYVVTHDTSEYPAAAAAAAARNPAATILPPVPRPARKGAAVVASCVNYAGYEEHGTSVRPGHPAFTPAVHAVSAGLKGIFRAFVREP